MPTACPIYALMSGLPVESEFWAPRKPFGKKLVSPPFASTPHIRTQTLAVVWLPKPIMMVYLCCLSCLTSAR